MPVKDESENRTMSHLAGPPVVFFGRVIQRCVICGAKLIDTQGQQIAIDPARPLEEQTKIPVWEAGKIVIVTTGSPVSYRIDQDDDGLTWPRNICIDVA